MQYKFTTYDPQIIEVLESLGSKKRVYIEIALRHFGNSKMSKDVLELIRDNTKEQKKETKKSVVKNSKHSEEPISKSKKIDLDKFL